MNTSASWDDSGDSSKLRMNTAPAMADHLGSSHPMALMPGHASRTTFPSNVLVNKSRRMSIADDIRNAHNIHPRLPPPPPIPLYPYYIGAERFQPRPPPPVPSSTPPPPRPPLPPSLTPAALRVSASPPPIPPKPFIAPFSSHGDDYLSFVPRSLMPGGHSAQVMDQVAETSESQADERDISMAIALSASVTEEEESQRRKLALQEEEDIAKAMQASILETRISGHSLLDSVFGSLSSDHDRFTLSNDNPEASEDEMAALLLASDKGYPTSVDTEHSQSVTDSNNDLSAATSASKQKLTATVLSNEPKGSTNSPTNREFLGSTSESVDSSLHILPIKHKAHVEHGIPSPSPSTSSGFPCPLPIKEEEEVMPLRVEKVSEVHPPCSDATFSTVYLTQSPESMTNVSLPNPVSSGSDNCIGQQESPSNDPIDRPSPASAQAYHSPARNSSYLPEHSPLAETPRDLPSGPSSAKSTPLPKHSDLISVRQSSTTSRSGGSPTVSEPLPPSYTETPLPFMEETTRPSTSHNTDFSSASTRNTTQFTSYTPPLSPLSLASASPSIQHRLPSIVSQDDLRAGSSTGHLSRNSSANSPTENDGSLSDVHSARPRVNSSINVNAFVNKELLNGVSLGFMTPTISPQLIPMTDELPLIISLPYGKARPLHLQGPSWRHLLKLMASLSGTRLEAALDAIATMKTTPKLRTVIQFVKPHRDSPVWRTVFYFTIDYPSQLPSIRHRSVNDLPYSYSLTPLPKLLRDAAESQISKTYTIPASHSVPLPTLPITFPNLALYMQAALEESRRYLHDSHSDYRKLAKMITTCYPDEDITPEPSERRGLFKRVMGLSSKPQKRGGNEDTYELVTPFVPDEWG